MEASPEAKQAPESVVEGQVWEDGALQWRVVYVGEGVHLREAESGRFRRLPTVAELTSNYRYVGNPLSDAFVMFRIGDVLRRSGVEDSERLIEAVQNLVWFRQRTKARA